MNANTYQAPGGQGVESSSREKDRIHGDGSRIHTPNQQLT